MKDERNEIARIRTDVVDDAGKHAISVALNVHDPASVEAFVERVAEKVLAHRMLSPPDTSLILFTIIGELTSQQFRKLWRTHTAPKSPLGVLMSLMTVADVIHGSPDGTVIDQCSLLDFS